MLCKSICHYQSGWRCFIQCCDRCRQIYDINEMDIEKVKWVLYLTKDALTLNITQKRKEEIILEIFRLEKILEQFNGGTIRLPE